mmetsp:Transcript_25301/g.68740  ORF Transcript_25301/g.68740 Transcript_25301/m.68740 type:complete len:234 (-) Transcript_25301:225-926(-)
MVQGWNPQLQHWLRCSSDSRKRRKKRCAFWRKHTGGKWKRWRRWQLLSSGKQNGKHRCSSSLPVRKSGRSSSWRHSSGDSRKPLHPLAALWRAWQPGSPRSTWAWAKALQMRCQSCAAVELCAPGGIFSSCQAIPTSWMPRSSRKCCVCKLAPPADPLPPHPPAQQRPQPPQPVPQQLLPLLLLLRLAATLTSFWRALQTSSPPITWAWARARPMRCRSCAARALQSAGTASP